MRGWALAIGLVLGSWLLVIAIMLGGALLIQAIGPWYVAGTIAVLLFAACVLQAREEFE